MGFPQLQADDNKSVQLPFVWGLGFWADICRDYRIMEGGGMYGVWRLGLKPSQTHMGTPNRPLLNRIVFFELSFRGLRAGFGESMAFVLIVLPVRELLR